MELNESIVNQYPVEVYNTALSIFIESNGSLVEKLFDSSSKDRFSIIHKLKGGASMLGLVKITNTLELAEVNPEKDEIVAKIPELFEDVKEFYKTR